MQKMLRTFCMSEVVPSLAHRPWTPAKTPFTSMRDGY